MKNMKMIDKNEIRFVLAPIAPVLVGNSVHYEWIAFRDEVNQIPIIDAEPVKHAHWIVIDEGSEGDEAFCHYWATLKCSRCGFERVVEDDYVPEYCEGCGAKMDKDEGD